VWGYHVLVLGLNVLTDFSITLFGVTYRNSSLRLCPGSLFFKRILQTKTPKPILHQGWVLVVFSDLRVELKILIYCLALIE
jgi:hypothetical protein